MIAKILIPIPKELELDYLIPDDIRNKIKIGSRVEIPFSKRKIIGFVYKITKISQKATKYITKIIDKEPLINEKLILLSEWMSKRFLISKGEALNIILPSSIKGCPKTKNIENEEKLLTPEFENDYEKYLFKDIYDKLSKDKIIALCIDSFHTKNRLYLDIITKEIKNNNSVLFLTPTKNKATGYYQYFLKYFNKDLIELYHNKTNAQKYSILLNFKKGKIKLLIGTRKNIFSYSEKLSTIIIEEEGSKYYKEEQKPFYETTEIAIKRGEFENLKILFSTFLPSMFLYKYLKEKNKYFFQINNLKIKKFSVKREKTFHNIYITGKLKNKIKETIRLNKKVIIYYQKIGYYSFLICENCSWVYKCDICEEHLIYKKEKDSFFCPSCKREYTKPSYCPKCRSKKFIFRGIGRERIEREIKNLLPLFNVINFDEIKKPSKKVIKNSHIIVGGENLFNYLDNIDTGLFIIPDFERALYIPDFRINELQFRALKKIEFYLKNHSKDSELIIQTRENKNKMLHYFLNNKTFDFLEEELKNRENYKFPPFSYIIKIEIRSDFKSIIDKNFALLLEQLNNKKQIKVYSKKIQEKENRFFSDIILKTESLNNFKFIKDALNKLKGNYNISIDTNYTLFK